MSNSVTPWTVAHGLEPTRLLCPWDFPGKNAGVGCHFLLQGIVSAQGSNPCLLHWQVGSLPLSYSVFRTCRVALVVKNPPANAGDIRDLDSIFGSGRSPRGGHNNPLQHSCLENPMDRGVWWARVHGVSKSQTPLSNSACTHPLIRICILSS